MHFDPQVWAWPQWTIAIMLAGGLAATAAVHGKPKVDAEKQPHTYSFPVQLMRFGFWVFVLIAGGFFA